MTKTLVHDYSSDSNLGGLCIEYQLERVLMGFKDSYVLALWTAVPSALKGQKPNDMNSGPIATCSTPKCPDIIGDIFSNRAYSGKIFEEEMFIRNHQSRDIL